MNRLLFFMANCLILASFEVKADECCECELNECEQQVEVQCVRYRPPETYENSKVFVPIERRQSPALSYPSEHQSSFFEQMTR